MKSYLISLLLSHLTFNPSKKSAVLPFTYDTNWIIFHLFQLYHLILHPHHLSFELLQQPQKSLLHFLSPTLIVSFAQIPLIASYHTLCDNMALQFFFKVIVQFSNFDLNAQMKAQFYFIFIFWPHCAACGILVPDEGLNPRPWQ